MFKLLRHWLEGLVGVGVLRGFHNRIIWGLSNKVGGQYKDPSWGVANGALNPKPLYNRFKAEGCFFVVGTFSVLGLKAWGFRAFKAPQGLGFRV